MSSLTRFGAQGQSEMKSVSAKSVSTTLIENGSPKSGHVQDIAPVAGIQSAKRICESVSLLWHLITPIRVVDLETGPENGYPKANVQTLGPAGIEVKVLTATQVELRTIFDLCKAVERELTIAAVKLPRKHREQSGCWIANTGTSHHA